MGLVSNVFTPESLSGLLGEMAVGHTRYSTTGSSRLINAQPFWVTGANGDLALAHNGNLINAVELRDNLENNWDTSFSSSTDSEVLAYTLANAPGKNWEERMSHCMRNLKGAFSVVVQTKDALLAFKDPLGIRPLCLGKLDEGWMVASESAAIDLVGGEFIRELKAGETVIIDDHGVHSFIWPGRDDREALCVFELIYFSRPDSILAGSRIYLQRRSMGARLAREYPVEADLVIGIPDSATAAAMGYSEESGIPYSDGLIRNRYVGRTFIEPDQKTREADVKIKFNTLPEIIKGKRLVVVDDSIVRATTTPLVIDMLRRAGAKEIHMRVCAPPIRWPCHFGVDMATRKELVAANHSEESICELIGADSLGYLSIKGLLEVNADKGKGFCHACFSGEYPIPIQLELDKMTLEDRKPRGGHF
jgi:amidophosphoribosyltransferase